MLTLGLILMGIGIVVAVLAFLRGASAPIVDDSLKYPFFGGAVAFVLGLALCILSLFF